MIGQADIIRGPTRPYFWAEWLTVERAAYALVVIVALGIRLWGLDTWSLTPAEAGQALPALTATTGVQPDLTGMSPLLNTLQRAVFALFGATDFAARFWPALLGGFSPLFFFALRDLLGRGGALSAAALWAFSPLAVWSSRLALGDALVPTLALAVLAAVVCLLQRSERAVEDPAAQRGPAAAWLGITAGLLLVSGKGAYTVVLMALAAALWWPGGARRLIAAARRERKALLTGFGAAVLLGATFFFLTPTGLAAAIALAGQWLEGLVPAGGEYGAWDILRRLLISEVFVLGFAVASLIWALRNGERFGQWAGLASLTALLVAVIGRTRHPLDLALVALPLTLLAGPAVSRVLRSAWGWRAEADPWLLVALSVALLFSAAICLPGAFDPRNGADWRQVYTGVGIGTALVSVVIWIAYGVFGSWRTVAQVWPVVPLLVGLLWGLSQTASLSFKQGAGRQAGAVNLLPATDTSDFAATLRNLGAQKGTGAREVKIDVVWPARVADPMLPILRWQLRDYPNARFSGSLPADPAPLVITAVAGASGSESVGASVPSDDGASGVARLGATYRGREFALLQRWTPANLGDFNAHLRWVLFREAKNPPEKLNVLLWVEQS